MQRSGWGTVAVVVLLTASLPHRALAKTDGDDPAPPVARAIGDCRTIARSDERLACYDAAAAAFDTALRNREILIADKEQVERTRRGLFGFAAPVTRLLGFGGDDSSSDIKEVQTQVTRVGQTADGGWKLWFADDSVWEQTDGKPLALSPKVGNPIRISRGALGTYFVSVRGQRGIKMRRVQ